MAYKLSSRSLGRMEGIDERMIEVVKVAIEHTKIDFGVTQGLELLKSKKNWLQLALQKL